MNMPDPQLGLPFGTTDNDINRLWGDDCPMCRGTGKDPGDDDGKPCPNCGGVGSVEIPF